METLENRAENSGSETSDGWMKRQWKKHRKSRWFVPIAVSFIAYEVATKVVLPGYFIHKKFFHEDGRKPEVTRNEEPEIYFVDFVNSAEAEELKLTNYSGSSTNR